MKTLIIDNYDSFTYNIYQYVGELGGNPEVVYNDQITCDQIKQGDYTHIILSPGPGHPANDKDIGVCKDIIMQSLVSDLQLPLLGVCLGHQAIVHLMGGEVLHAPSVMHGKTSIVSHDGSGLFRGVDTRFEVMRYHSFMTDSSSFPSDLRVTSRTCDGDEVIMSFEHRILPVLGVQFHPESVGSEWGKAVLGNFLGM